MTLLEADAVEADDTPDDLVVVLAAEPAEDAVEDLGVAVEELAPVAEATLDEPGVGGLISLASSTGFARGLITCHHERCFDEVGAGAGAAAAIFLEVATGAGAAVTFGTAVTLALGAGNAAEGIGAPSVGTGGLSVGAPVGIGAVVWGCGEAAEGWYGLN